MRFPTCFNPKFGGKRARFYLIRDLMDRVQLLTSSFVTLGNRTTVFRIQSFGTPFREHPQVPYKNSYSHPARLSSGEAVYSTYLHLRLCPKQLASTQHPYPRQSNTSAPTARKALSLLSRWASLNTRITVHPKSMGFSYLQPHQMRKNTRL